MTSCRFARFPFRVLLLVILGCVMSAGTASAQDVISKEAAAALKAPFIADLEEMKTNARDSE